MACRVEQASMRWRTIGSRSRIKRLIVTTPIASVDAVDRMHILGDELHVIGVTENFMGTNHYYDNNDIPDRDTIVKMILNSAIPTWR